MTDPFVQRAVVIGIVVIAILCVGGMIALAATGHPVEDSLKIGLATTLGILGGALGVKAGTNEPPPAP